MSTKLENLFNLPSAKLTEQDQFDDEVESEDEQVTTAVTVARSTLAHIEDALPAVAELALIDSELDTIADKAMASFEDLSDLGMNVDSRFAAEIFSVASSMMGHALSAKTAKANRKLKTIELQMKKLKLELDMARQSGSNTSNQINTVSNLQDAEGRVLSRNELLDMLKGDNDSTKF